MNLRRFERRRVRLTDIDGEVFVGKAYDYIFPDDNEPEGLESISVRTDEGRSIEFYENEIKSIELI